MLNSTKKVKITQIMFEWQDSYKNGCHWLNATKHPIVGKLSAQRVDWKLSETQNLYWIYIFFNNSWQVWFIFSDFQMEDFGSFIGENISQFLLFMNTTLSVKKSAESDSWSLTKISAEYSFQILCFNSNYWRGTKLQIRPISKYIESLLYSQVWGIEAPPLVFPKELTTFWMK